MTDTQADALAVVLDHGDNARKVVAFTLASICPLLNEAAIGTVVIEYDGYGDEGQVNDIVLKNVAGSDAPMPQVRCQSYWLTFQGQIAAEETTMAQALDRFATEALETLHPGWENNEGAAGTLTIQVATACATLEHSTRYVAIETATHQLGG